MEDIMHSKRTRIRCSEKRLLFFFFPSKRTPKVISFPMKKINIIKEGQVLAETYDHLFFYYYFLL